MNPHISHAPEESAVLLFEDKSLAHFLLNQFLQLAIFGLGLYVLFPALWSEQLEYGALLIVTAFLLMHLFASFFEFFFHRYILHLKLIPLLKLFADKHAHHHELTPVKEVIEDGVHKVENNFPILIDAQRPHSVFPWYALLGFAITFTPVILLAQWLLPGLPMIFGGYLTVFVSYLAYEIIHANEHRSYVQWWKPRIEKKYSGFLWKRLYSFHLTHHANTLCNQAIGGFLGFPLPDLLLGTYKKPSQLLVDDAIVKEDDFVAPQGIWPIRLLDKVLGVVR